ncbi:ExbD/TolR family protein [Magnetospirillum aberrantis]|uniref:Biopolymer transporter ExbD n=1 Tax=Magnetospirillum aberrantis SpK TaxID=908842 RepID=A0A7C9UV73_9PROT|nr:biopolymer transporter ExbD [Magnetospirillum aberrantis]NFV79252.1 biopolymer transporter ExbD [Magnetospirillum aberrantis SpK]
MAVSVPPDDGDDDEAVMVDINTTPLVDVMLVLLIIFLITVPVISVGVPVNLPREQAAPLLGDAGTVILSLDGDGRLFWDDTPLSGFEELQDRLRLVAAAHPAIQLRGDADLPFAAVAKIMDACRQAGLTRLGFVLRPE